MLNDPLRCADTRCTSTPVSGLKNVQVEILLIGGAQYHLYGNPGYALRPYIITPLEGAALTPDDTNIIIKCLKIALISKGSSRTSNITFPCRYSEEDSRLYTPGGAWYQASCLLWNSQCCLDESPSSTFSDCTTSP
jgi:hypothetical protein